MLDKDQQKLLLGEASICTGEGLIFNMTPSPGATSCLGNAERDLKYIVKYLGKNFNEEKFNNELTDGEYCVLRAPIESQKAVVNLIRAEIKELKRSIYKSYILVILMNHSGMPRIVKYKENYEKYIIDESIYTTSTWMQYQRV